MASSDAESSAYFYTSICKTLCDTIDDLVCADRIEPQLGAKIFRNFLPCFQKVFAESVKDVVNIKGRLQYYRNCDNKWWWVVRDCTIKLGTGARAEMLHVDKLRIVGYPTADEVDRKGGGGSGSVAGKIKQGTKRGTKRGTK